MRFNRTELSFESEILYFGYFIAYKVNYRLTVFDKCNCRVLFLEVHVPAGLLVDRVVTLRVEHVKVTGVTRTIVRLTNR